LAKPFIRSHRREANPYPYVNLNPFSLRRTCRQAAALLIAREDQVLAVPDRVALKLHLMACKACPKFENQVLTMRAAMGQWRNYTGEPGGPGNASKPASKTTPDA
jgi:hypothetical protein